MGKPIPTRAAIVAALPTQPPQLAALVKAHKGLPTADYVTLENKWGVWTGGTYTDHTTEAAQRAAAAADVLRAQGYYTRRQAAIALGFRAPRDYDIAAERGARLPAADADKATA